MAQLPVDIPDLVFNQGFRLAGNMNHENHKLIAADPADIIIRAKAPFQHGNNLFQHQVPGFVSVPVIDVFKLIGVKQQHGGGAEIQAGFDEIAR